MPPLALTIAILVAAAAIEGVAAGPGSRAYLRSLRQPKWAPPFAVWVAIGAVYYAIFGAILYRSLPATTGLKLLSVALVILILAVNGGWNYLFFRRRDLSASWRVLPVYSVIVAGLFLVLLVRDPLGAVFVTPYLAYLPFALLWVGQLRKLNANTPK